MESDYRDILCFISAAGRLKRLRRSGWVNRKIESPESVGDHTFRLCLLVLVFCKHVETVDRQKCLEMALVHDLAESIVGDITPYDGIAKEQKFQIEKAAILRLTKGWSDNSILDLWLEYESATTEEAKLVKDLDAIEATLQALEYSDFDASKQLAQEFIESARNKLLTASGKGLLDQLLVTDWRSEAGSS